MACMCGDLQCPSCGPAQGNWKCIICGMWADDPCEHLTEDGQASDNNRWGNYKPEFHAQCEEEARKIEEAEAQMEEESHYPKTLAEELLGMHPESKFRKGVIPGYEE